MIYSFFELPEKQNNANVKMLWYVGGFAKLMRFQVYFHFAISIWRVMEVQLEK